MPHSLFHSPSSLLYVFSYRGYVAPEFYNGQITFNLDMYSLGVIVMEILTGQKGYSTVDKVRKTMNWIYK